MKESNFSAKVASLLMQAALEALSIAGLCAGVSAQAPAALSSTPAPAPVAPVVTDVYRLGREKKQDRNRSSAGIGDIIVVKMQGLQALVNQATCQDENSKAVQNCRKQEITLYLDGRKITGSVPESIESEQDTGQLQFHLQRTTENDEAWADLLGDPLYNNAGFFKRPTEVSVGLEDGYPKPTEVTRFQLIRIRKGASMAASVGLLLVLWWLARLAKTTDLLRDSGPTLPGKQQRPFSLARCQMAVWFVTVVASFLFIRIVTGSTFISDSALALMGIGAGTALGAAVIDLDQPDPNKPTTTIGLLNDIVTSNGTTYSFHRFQIIVWTIVLWCLFVVAVWTRLSMPDFSATLLALQGISAGTYLGFKLTENKSNENKASTGPVTNVGP